MLKIPFALTAAHFPEPSAVDKGNIPPIVKSPFLSNRNAKLNWTREMMIANN